MADLFAYCEKLVREADKDRFLASLFAPAERRGALMALHAFNVEVGRVAALVHQPLAAAVRLQWWREVLAGERSEEASGHPVAAALTRAVAEHALPFAAFDALLDARLFDATEEAMPTSSELEAYARNTSAALFELAIRILAPHDADALEPLARTGGIAYAYARLLQAQPQYVARHKLIVPLDLLQRHGAQAEDLFAGRVTAPLRAALAELRREAWAQLAEFDRLLPRLPAQAASAVLPVALVRPLLERMERSDYGPLHPIEIPQWRRQWFLWRAAGRWSREGPARE